MTRGNKIFLSSEMTGDNQRCLTICGRLHFDHHWFSQPISRIKLRNGSRKGEWSLKVYQQVNECQSSAVAIELSYLKPNPRRVDGLRQLNPATLGGHSPFAEVAEKLHEL